MPSATTENAPALHEKDLFVNDGQLPPEYIGLVRPTTLDTPIEEIRRRYREDGHVLVKGVLPREDVLKAREKYFSLLAPTGVLAPGTAPVEGIFNTAKDRLNFPGIGAGPDTIDADSKVTGPDPAAARRFGDLAIGAHNEDWYKELCRHPALHKFVGEMTGWGENTHGLTRTILRNNMPGNKAVGVHYDQIFLRHGDDGALTAWVPIGDVKIDGGGLIYLEKGHELGAEMERGFTERAKAQGFSDEETRHAYNKNMMDGGLLTEEPLAFAKEHGRRWLLAEYEAGDVIFHNSYAIHASTINHDKNNVIRLGTDLRYVDKTGNWDSRWTEVFRYGDGL